MKKENNILKRLVIFGTILLLLTGAITPLITATPPHFDPIDLDLDPSNGSLLAKCDPIEEGPEHDSDFNPGDPEPETVQVEVSRWTEDDEIETTVEWWMQDKCDAFFEAMELIYDPGDGEGTGDPVEAMQQTFSIMQQYGFIPQDKTQTDLENFLADQYNQHQQTIEDFMQQHGGDLLTLNPDVTLVSAFLSGFMNGPIDCVRIPGIVQVLETYDGAYVTWRTFVPLNTGVVYGHGWFAMINYIWIGIFVPPLHNGPNPFSKVFAGFSFVTDFYDFED